MALKFNDGPPPVRTCTRGRWRTDGRRRNGTKSTSSSLLHTSLEVEGTGTAPKRHKSTSGSLLHAREVVTARKSEARRWVGNGLGFVSPSLGWIHGWLGWIRCCWVGFTVVGVCIQSLGSHRHRRVIFAAVDGSRVEATENSTSGSRLNAREVMEKEDALKKPPPVRVWWSVYMH